MVLELTQDGDVIGFLDVKEIFEGKVINFREEEYVVCGLFMKTGKLFPKDEDEFEEGEFSYHSSENPNNIYFEILL